MATRAGSQLKSATPTFPEVDRSTLAVCHAFFHDGTLHWVTTPHQPTRCWVDASPTSASKCRKAARCCYTHCESAALLTSRTSYFRRLSANPLVISRACSTNTPAGGLKVRPFNETMLIGDAEFGSSTGRTFSRTLGGLKRKNICPCTPRNSPLATRLLVHWAEATVTLR